MTNEKVREEGIQKIYDKWKRIQAYLFSLFIIVWFIPLWHLFPGFPEVVLKHYKPNPNSLFQLLVLLIIGLAILFTEFMIKLRVNRMNRGINLFGGYKYLKAYHFKPLLFIVYYLVLLEVLFWSITLLGY